MRLKPASQKPPTTRCSPSRGCALTRRADPLPLIFRFLPVRVGAPAGAYTVRGGHSYRGRRWCSGDGLSLRQLPSNLLEGGLAQGPPA